MYCGVVESFLSTAWVREEGGATARLLMIRARVATGPYLVYTHRGRDGMLPGVRLCQEWSQRLFYVISTVLVREECWL